MKIRISSILFILLILMFALASQAAAQAENGSLSLRLRKVFGYNSFGNSEIQGSMSLQATGPEDLARVVFLIDGEQLGEATQAPFSMPFHTDSFANGVHTLSATGYTLDGSELRSNEIRTNFVPASKGGEVALKFIVPLLAVVLGAGLLSLLVPALTGRGKAADVPFGSQRKYGVAGGTICPRCSRPFPMHAMAPNLTPIHRLERCPFCGKWGLMRRKSTEELLQAERAELKLARETGQVPTQTEEEKLRKELENSRYHDL